MLLETGDVRELGEVTEPWLRFGEAAPGERTPPTGSRFLVVDEAPAFELSFWCGTCAFVFQRMSGANQKASIAALSEQLAAGLEDLDEGIIAQFAQILPTDSYRPMLLQIEPRLVQPHQSGDYFAHEQLQTW